MINDETRAILSYALRHPVGQYAAPRTSQLSGIPQSTLYEWRRSGTYVPDLTASNPTGWSYRDLVFLRVLAWLRQGGMPRRIASEQVGRIKRDIAKGVEIRYIHATKTELVVEPETASRTSGTSLLPWDDIYEYIRVFDIEEPVEELHVRENGKLWAPNLVTPSQYTSISPWVLAGDPCVQRTRIPTASIFALSDERGLDPEDIAVLYPDLTTQAIEDAYLLERRLRGLEEPIAA